MRIYKRGKTWYIDYNCDGKRIREAISENKAEAQAALAARQTDILRGRFEFKKESSIRFKKLAEDYLKHSKENKKSWKRDQASINKLIPFFGDKLLSNITNRDVETYKSERKKEKNKRFKEDKEERKIIEGATVNRELACLRHMFNIAIKWGLIDKNPVQGIKMFKEQEAIRIYNSYEINRLLNSASGQLKSIIIIALNTGMRRSEILKMAWKDIDYDMKYIHIKEAKGGKPRRVPMNNKVIETLKNIPLENDFVFHNPKTNNRIKNVRKSFLSACEKVGIKNPTFHALRHTAATQMILGGIDIVTVKEILGHSDIKMTLRYAHPTPESKLRAVNALETAFHCELEMVN